jgi:inhibitor of cysteine peptidase
MNARNALWISILAAMLVFTAACTTMQPPYKPPVTPPDQPGLETTDELKKFSSVSEIRDYLKQAQEVQGYGGQVNRGGFGVMEEMTMDAVATKSAAPAPQAAGGGADEFSQTNVQVIGVDEADMVKNDNKFIYTIVQDKLVIVDAYPAGDAEVVSTTELDGRPVNMFINKDRLVVFSMDSDEIYTIPEYGYMPVPRNTQVTKVTVYDITDRSDPDEVEDFVITGNYYQSRMIGDYVYFITQEQVYYYQYDMPMPRIAAASRVIMPDVYYFPNPETNYNFNTIASFNIQDTDELNAQTFMMGYSNTLYVSQDNIYITYQKNPPWRYYKEHTRDRFFEVVVPLLPSDIQQAIGSIQADSSLNTYEQWDKISATLEEMYNRMDSSGRMNLMDDIEDAIEEYEIQQEIERRKSVIHKINIKDGAITYDTRGEVPGYLLNQFSLDEHDSNLRVATTTQLWLRSRGSQQFNNVYVLDKDLDIIGRLEGLAEDEQIYSTRFIGDRLYMVTFKRIDPLFVIDLSSPRDPEVLGKLKIPGYSDYLHPYDEDHIIGLGKETDSNQWGGTSIRGVKLALFDVSDVEHPKQVDKFEIGESGTESEALRDHKAFLFDKDKNLLVIPIQERDNRWYDGRYYRYKVWQGAYVFSLTPEDGFELRGRITHLDGDENDNYWYHSPSAVRRSLYMDDVLYTVSASKVKMNDIDTVAEIKEVELPFREQKYYDYPWWY